MRGLTRVLKLFSRHHTFTTVAHHLANVTSYITRNSIITVGGKKNPCLLRRTGTVQVQVPVQPVFKRGWSKASLSPTLNFCFKMETPKLFPPIRNSIPGGKITVCTPGWRWFTFSQLGVLGACKHGVWCIETCIETACEHGVWCVETACKHGFWCVKTACKHGVWCVETCVESNCSLPG